MNSQLINVLAQLKTASLNKKESIIVNFSSLSLFVIKALYKEGFIQSFKIISIPESNRAYILLHLRYYFNNPIFKRLKLLSNSSKIKVLDFYNLSRLNIKKDVLFLSTSKGIFTLTECKQQKLGGVLFFIC